MDRDMADAEREQPGFVYRYGWSQINCPRCHETIYAGRRIEQSDAVELVELHDLSCTPPG